MSNLRKSKGFSMLEVVLVLSIISIAFVGVARMMADSAAAMRAKATAERLEQISSAASAYVNTRRVAIDTWFSSNPNGTITIPVGKQSQSASQPIGTSGFESLQDAGFLPAGFVDINPAEQNHAVLVKKTDTNIEVLVTAIHGRAISDKDLSIISSTLGAAGGAVYESLTATPNTHVVGSYGGWTYARSQWVGSLNNVSIGPERGRPAFSLTIENAAASSNPSIFACSREQVETGGGIGVGNTCFGATIPAPPCPPGYQDMGAEKIVCNYTSGGSPLYTERRACEKIICGQP